jgi:pimeloyl-ACP methyl ester carboxylesterase
VSAMSEISDFFLKNSLRLLSILCNPFCFKALAVGFCFKNADSAFSFFNLYQDATQGNVHNVRQYFTCSHIYNCTPQLCQVRAPILLLYGEKDRSSRRYAQLLKKHLPTSTFCEVKQKPHHLPTKAAFEINAQIKKWIDQQRALTIPHA